MLKITAFGILFLTSSGLLASTELILNRQTQANAISIATTVFGPVQIQLREGRHNQILLDTVLDGPGIFTVSDLPPTEINRLQLRSVLGPPHPNVLPFTYQLPFDTQNVWHISQGFHGAASHHDLLNDFAIDFALPIGTEIMAARTGTVMEVIDSFPDTGSARVSELDRANVIRILHEDGTMSVYGHLMQGSALVTPGQWLVAGSPLAQSGNSGYTHGPHLHFAVQINTDLQLQAIPFEMQSPNGLVLLNP